MQVEVQLALACNRLHSTDGFDLIIGNLWDNRTSHGKSRDQIRAMHHIGHCHNVLIGEFHSHRPICQVLIDIPDEAKVDDNWAQLNGKSTVEMQHDHVFDLHVVNLQEDVSSTEIFGEFQNGMAPVR